MLLKFFRKKLKTFLWITIIGIVPPFLFFYGYSRSRNINTYILARVNGEPIWVEDFYREIETLGEAYPFIKDPLQLRKMAYQRLLEKTLLLQEAKKMRLRVTPEEKLEFIKSLPYFRDKEGKFRSDYLASLPEEELRRLENIARENILMDKVRSYFFSRVKVTDKEIEERFQRDRAKFSLLVLGKDVDKVKLSQNPGEEELKEFMNRHRDRFRVGPFFKLEWLKVDVERFIPEIKVEDREIRDYYTSHQKEFKKSDTEFIPLEEVRERIEEKIRRNRAWQKAGEVAFDLSVELLEEDNWEKKVGKEYTIKKTDKWVGRGDIFPLLGIGSPLVEKAPLKEASEPVKVKDGFVIFRVLEKKPRYLPPWDEVKDKVREIWEKEKKKEMARQIMEKVRDELLKEENREKIKEKYGLVEEEKKGLALTSFLPGWGYIPEMVEELRKMKKGDWSRVFLTPRRAGIFQLLDIEGPSLKELTPKLKENIKRILVREKGEELFQRWMEEKKKASEIEVIREDLLS